MVAHPNIILIVVLSTVSGMRKLFSKKRPSKAQVLPKSMPLKAILHSPSKLRVIGHEGTENPVLSFELCQHIRQCLPPIQQESMQWEVVHSIDIHGTSLSGLVEKLQCCQNPLILAIRNEDNEIFGAYLSESLKFQSGFYGNGTCFLFKERNNGIKVYLTTGVDENYIHSKNAKSGLHIGSGVKNGFGLYLDETLSNGHTEESTTFANEPLCRAGKFQITGLELIAIM